MDLIDKEISKITMEGFGWNLDEFNHATPVTSHFVYFRDWCFKKTWLVSLAQNDFNNTKITTAVNFGDVVAGVATIINKIVRGQTLSPEENEAYAPLLTNYIKQTQSYQAWRRQFSSDQRLHFIINVYADSKIKKNAVKLRPFIINSYEIMLRSEEVEEYTAQVQRVDKQKHPEWFR
ncbi:hypothetical protein L6R44_11300 [Enterobacter cloacae complex sp. ECC445]|uniref:hypothetical protein n=1 Tax=Enterobacter cloacae complex sp. ECC445 TaxID=2913213 RepID=UPI001F44B21D|nr:hypothetical protein [Enterobacter cloacae complex sp. ECC445]MCG0456693.1 hypothetical protein [Enterobacter cloacae complex sp. ECC445]